MRLERLSLKGLTEFTEPVDLDFSTIPAGALIAVVGANGAGKTSLMEACLAALFRRLPTREKPMKAYFNGKDGFIDATYLLDDGVRYRARVNVDGVSGASEAVLERIVDGRATRLNDGKVSTFDTAIATIFPPLDALLASSFAAQNGDGSFATRNKTERKDLFTTLLGLHQLDGFATSSRAAASVIEKRLAELRGRREGLSAAASDEVLTQLQHQVESLEADLTAAAREVTDLTGAVQACDLGPLQADVQRLATIITERAGFEASKAEQLRQRQAATADLGAVDADERRELSMADGRTQHTVRQHDEQLSDLVSEDAIFGDERRQIARIVTAFDAFKAEKLERIAKNNELKDRAEAIRAAATAAADARTRLVNTDTQRDARVAALDGANARVTAAERQLRDVDDLLAERTRVGRVSNLLLDVPCGGEGEFAGCQFLKDATVASARYLELGAMRLDQKRETAVAALTDAQFAVTVDRQAINALRADAQELTTLLDRYKADADLLPFLEVAEQRITELETAISAGGQKAVADQDEVHAAAQARVTARETERTRLAAAIADAQRAGDAEAEEIRRRNGDRRQQVQERRDGLDASLAGLEAQLVATAGAAAAHTEAKTALEEAQRRRNESQQRLSAAEVSQARLEEQVAIVRRRQEECRQRVDECARLTDLITADENDLIDWQALAQVMGRDGLPVLEIDAAGPGVSAETNDLLQASFGGRFVVELVTQEAKADGKGMKEIFELKVYDHDRGGVDRDLADLSGGEQVIVDQALKSAIALFINRRNDRPIRTCWRDESDTGLDTENALRYIPMLRRLHERAGLHHLLFISHHPAVVAQADVQLQVADGRVTVAYPPFAPAAASAEAA